MKVGTVTGRVWATKRHEKLPAGALVRLEMEGGGILIAFDSFGVGIGERVLVILGSVAASYCEQPVEAVVVGIIDDNE